MTNLAHTRHSRVIINLEAIRKNYQFLKQTAPDSKVIAVIKADAYGHGAVEVAKAIPFADAFAVATSLEAIPLREAGIQQKIIVLGGVVDATEMQFCIDYKLDPVFHQFWQLDLLKSVQATETIDIWLKFNSGMGRLGFSEHNLIKAINLVKEISTVDTTRLMTHLANADDVNDSKSLQQIEAVQKLNLHQYEWGISNSAAVLGWPQSRKKWVRSGIALYGSDPLHSQKYVGHLKPVMTFTSQIMAINKLQKGQSIGYGGLYTCTEDTVVGVVAAGYADGYPRHLQNGYVTVNGEKAAVLGRVSMDMITINLTNLNTKPGDEVILWGEHPLAAEVATLSETISYELFCHAGCHGKKEYENI